MSFWRKELHPIWDLDSALGFLRIAFCHVEPGPPQNTQLWPWFLKKPSLNSWPGYLTCRSVDLKLFSVLAQWCMSWRKCSQMFTGVMRHFLYQSLDCYGGLIFTHKRKHEHVLSCQYQKNIRSRTECLGDFLVFCYILYLRVERRSCWKKDSGGLSECGGSVRPGLLSR